MIMHLPDWIIIQNVTSNVCIHRQQYAYKLLEFKDYQIYFNTIDVNSS